MYYCVVFCGILREILVDFMRSYYILRVFLCFSGNVKWKLRTLRESPAFSAYFLLVVRKFDGNCCEIYGN